MKKIIILITAFCLISCIAMTGCSSNSTTEETSATQTTVTSETSIDLDLTKLSSTMIYSEVYNMMTTPQNYIGKTIKIKGLCYSNYYQETNKTYYFVIISDATACCQQGIEFIVKNDISIPVSYPTDGTAVEITGIFDRYDELGQTYYYLLTDQIIR